LAALMHGTLVVGVSQTAALNRGRHLYSAGRPSRWALAHTSSFINICILNIDFQLEINGFGRGLDRLLGSYNDDHDDAVMKHKHNSTINYYRVSILLLKPQVCR